MIEEVTESKSDCEKEQKADFEFKNARKSLNMSYINRKYLVNWYKTLKNIKIEDFSDEIKNFY